MITQNRYRTQSACGDNLVCIQTQTSVRGSPGSQANLCFGGHDNSQLIMLAERSIWVVPMAVGGASGNVISF